LATHPQNRGRATVYPCPSFQSCLFSSGAVWNRTTPRYGHWFTASSRHQPGIPTPETPKAASVSRAAFAESYCSSY